MRHSFGHMLNKNCLDCGKEMTLTIVSDGQYREYGYHCDMCEEYVSREAHEDDAYGNTMIDHDYY